MRHYTAGGSSDTSAPVEKKPEPVKVVVKPAEKPKPPPPAAAEPPKSAPAVTVQAPTPAPAVKSEVGARRREVCKPSTPDLNKAPNSATRFSQNFKPLNEEN